MTLTKEPGTIQAGFETENQDPFAITPPRKIETRSPAPTTPQSKTKANTPLHKRFLEEVKMSPGTPPKTPSRSPKRGGKDDARLEVGQNGFYFSMEIPERKIVSSRPTSRAATPDAKTGRVTQSPMKGGGRLTPSSLSPSPQKYGKGDVKSTPTGGGRVRDILRKNLFGSPTKKATRLGWGGDEQRNDVRTSPTKGVAHHSQMSNGSESERSVQEAAIALAAAPPAAQVLGSSGQTSTQPSTLPLPPAIQKSEGRTRQHQASMETIHTPKPVAEAALPLEMRKAHLASTPSNIGHLMANHSNKSAKVQTLPPTGGRESMPTPLRKMQEKLGLRSPHIVRQETNGGYVNEKDPANSSTELALSPISSLTINDVAWLRNEPTSTAAGCALGAATTTALDIDAAKSNDTRLKQLLPSLINTSLAIASGPSTATTPSGASPSTPSRPGLSSRSKSFGTPARLRSSMQEDMFKVQESLKRSLGQEAFQNSASRPTTPLSPLATASRPSTSSSKHSSSNTKQVTRPVSMFGPPKPNAPSATQSVPRRPLSTAARKPRPKSMIVGSAKILDTVASQIDSPRERAKLRSNAGAPTTQHRKPAVLRPETVHPRPRASKPAGTAPKPETVTPIVRTTKSATLRMAPPPKRAALPAATTTPVPPKQRTVSAEVIANQVAAWNKQDTSNKPPTPPPKFPMRSKSMKKPLNPLPTQAKRHTTAPHPRPHSSTPRSFTPPGLPTQLPMSPSKKLLVAPATPARRPTTVRKPLPPSAAARARGPALTPLAQANKRHTWVEGMAGDLNALRAPSREIQSKLDRAIDRKIAEDRRRAGWI